MKHKVIEKHTWWVVLLLASIAALMIILSGCTTMATEYRKNGFKELQRSFSALPEMSIPMITVKLENVTVKIVANRSSFEWDKAAAYSSPVLGYATRKNEIYLFGAMVDGKIVVNQGILGHELNHLLNFENNIIADPDKLDDMGS